jgi:hypothetical protein
MGPISISSKATLPWQNISKVTHLPTLMAGHEWIGKQKCVGALGISWIMWNSMVLECLADVTTCISGNINLSWPSFSCSSSKVHLILPFGKLNKGAGVSQVLPPLLVGFDPFIQTNNGGLLRSMNLALFKNAKNNYCLVLQASSIVLLAEMGSGIMDVLHDLASVGIEKLSMHANKLMALENANGKMIPQIDWNLASALEYVERDDLLDNNSIDALIGGDGNATFGKKNKESSSRHPVTHFVFMVCTSLCIGSPLAIKRNKILSSERFCSLLPIVGLHIFSFIAGYWIFKLLQWRQEEPVCRIISVCTGLQSSTLAGLLDEEYGVGNRNCAKPNDGQADWQPIDDILHWHNAIHKELHDIAEETKDAAACKFF